MPPSHSKFAIDRDNLVESLSEVALATNDDSKMVCLDLSPEHIRLSAASTGIGESSATLAAEFLGGGDAVIHTAFNPAYLLDALRSLSGDSVMIDIDQNGYGCDGKVFGKPALLYAQHDPTTCWVIMPVNAGLPATRENLGSNFPEGLGEAAGIA
jgi:DNA polymerase III sliding clamp (beta) subunit (PCNA family)